jgi:lysozyme
MHVSPAGRAFIGVQEGLRLRAYRDTGGIWTIGYGHTSMAGMPHVVPGMTITKTQADIILARDLLKYEAQVLAAVKVPLSQCQFDALVSFTYNCGEGSLRKLVALSGLNNGHYGAVPLHMMAYDVAGGRVLPALVRRRKAEAAMFQGRYPSRVALTLASMLGTYRGAKESMEAA